ncbi:aspartate aminotransferase family protein [Acidisoma cellulosilytica]|uniref:Aspartate aminotransferase family protein n=1 Tax=Acidisoma cellulosilyticum TaxID=2802395 RepID=A0A964E5W1_9PROT|nr:aminotransferase class III-fold pyridoxal phosphate-dependent enzyme [Acidisoma cellulosilyticum]MCB8882857.1 aspartate aminotransferase family protein [Acidisoma cellulosilyticum]
MDDFNAKAGFFSGGLGFASKAEVLEKAAQYWNPHKTKFWQESGTDLVIGRRAGYELFDVSGKRLIDLHLNGGTYNLGHRNPELVEAMRSALDIFDMGNHHFPSLARTALAEALAATAPWDGCRTIFGSGGGEAIDIALKSARHATGRRKIVSVIKAYHGHTGLAVCTGDARFSERFLSDRPDEFIQVPFNDLDAMEQALAGEDIACVIMETIPATYGFPMPAETYLPGVKALCERTGALYIADEVQTGLMRTGTLWAITGYGVTPDIIVAGKGIGGGLYPLGVVLVSPRAGRWLEEDGFAHMSTGGGAELGCIVALKALEITLRPESIANGARVAARLREGLEALQSRHSFFNEIRQNGLVIGLGFDHPTGARFVSRALYERGIWAIFSTLDPRILQFKPGLLMDAALTEETLSIIDAALQAVKAMPELTGGG